MTNRTPLRPNNRSKCRCLALGDLCPYCDRFFAVWFRREMLHMGFVLRHGGAA